MTVRPFSAVPGPQGPDMLRAVRRIRRDPVAFLADCRDRYGPVCAFPIPRTPVVLLNDPADVRRVLQGNHRAYCKRTVQYRSLSLLTGDGLLVSDGQVWRSARRLLQPAFHRDHLASVCGAVAEAAESLSAEWERQGAGATVDVEAAMLRTTLHVVADTLFGADLGRQAQPLVAAVAEALDVVVARAQVPLPMSDRLPTPANRRLAHGVDAVDRAVERLLVLRRRSAPSRGGDALGLLVDGLDGGTMTAQQVRDEVVTLIVAGHETVASALTWAWARLARSPDWTERVRTEARRAGPCATVEELPVARAVVDETLRLHPPAWVVSRRSLEADELGGFAVPVGTVVMISPALLHRDPALWPEPDRFDPDRFLAPQASVPRDGYLPFGAGPRLCIGRDLALVEATLLLSALARRFDVDPLRPDAATGPAVRGVTSRPRGGLPSRVRRRPGQ